MVCKAVIALPLVVVVVCKLVMLAVLSLIAFCKALDNVILLVFDISMEESEDVILAHKGVLLLSIVKI